MLVAKDSKFYCTLIVEIRYKFFGTNSSVVSHFFLEKLRIKLYFWRDICVFFPGDEPHINLRFIGHRNYRNERLEFAGKLRLIFLLSIKENHIKFYWKSGNNISLAHVISQAQFLRSGNKSISKNILSFPASSCHNILWPYWLYMTHINIKWRSCVNLIGLIRLPKIWLYLSVTFLGNISNLPRKK